MAVTKKETAEVVAPSDLEGGYHLEIELNGVVRTLVVVCFVFLVRWRSLENASRVLVRFLILLSENSGLTLVLNPCIAINQAFGRSCCWADIYWCSCPHPGSATTNC